MTDYTLVITSCGRHRLLKQTWDLFQQTKDIPPREIIVVEDGPDGPPDWFPRHSAKWLTNGVRRGQIFSIDKAYDCVTTPYIFHCEDDWGFQNSGYIGESLEILEKYPDILQVWLRGIPTPAEIRDIFTIYKVEPDPKHPSLSNARYHWDGWHGGFSFNPSLRRLSDYRRIGSYGRWVGYDSRACGERQIGRLYSDLGFRAAILPRSYVYHIGDESHINRKENPAAKKILVAIPTADNLDYTEFREKQRQTYGRIWEKGISGLQVNGPNTRRRAVEDTWWNDLKAHPNVTAKFFTGAELGCSDKFVDLPEKNRCICVWALQNGFDVMVRLDDDSFAYTDRLIRQTLEWEGDYAGSDCGGFAIGGAGVWLSRRAMEWVAAAEIPRGEWRDDAFIGQVLKHHGVSMEVMPGCAGEGHLLGKPITEHPIDSELMREMYDVCPTNPANFAHCN